MIPSSESAPTAAESWPFPPSTITRSGTVQAASRRAASAVSSSIGPAFGSRSSSPPSSRSPSGASSAPTAASDSAPVSVAQPGDAAEPAPEDLGHHPEVVGRVTGPDPEAPVLARLRLAVDEHDHRADRGRPLDVAHVVALDPLRRARQLELASEVRERLVPTGGIGHPLGPLALERLDGVLRRERDEATLLPAFRHRDGDANAPPVGEVRGQVIGVGRHQWDEEGARERIGRRVVLLQEGAEHLGIGHVTSALDDEVLSADELAVPHLHHLEAGLVLLAGPCRWRRARRG